MNRVASGERFGRLTFVKMLPPRGAGLPRQAIWLCDCGKETNIAITRVKNGYSQSCGCLAIEVSRTCNTKHGMRYSSEYSSWQAMKGRCLDPDNKDYPHWGGRGVTIHSEWIFSFEMFFAHIGRRPRGTTLDRIDNTKGYGPGNVRWATPQTQARNRSNFRIINTPLGRMPLVDYAERIGLSNGAAHLRMKRGKLEGCSYV